MHDDIDFDKLSTAWQSKMPEKHFDVKALEKKLFWQKLKQRLLLLSEIAILMVLPFMLYLAGWQNWGLTASVWLWFGFLISLVLLPSIIISRRRSVVLLSSPLDAWMESEIQLSHEAIHRAKATQTLLVFFIIGVVGIAGYEIFYLKHWDLSLRITSIILALIVCVVVNKKYQLKHQRFIEGG